MLGGGGVGLVPATHKECHAGMLPRGGQGAECGEHPTKKTDVPKRGDVGMGTASEFHRGASKQAATRGGPDMSGWHASQMDLCRNRLPRKRTKHGNAWRLDPPPKCMHRLALGDGTIGSVY